MTFAASRWEAHVGHKTTVRLVQDAMHAAARAQSSKQLVLQQVQSKATLQEYIEFKKRVRHPVAPLWGARSLHWLVSACRKCSRERRRGGAERGISSLRGSGALNLTRGGDEGVCQPEAFNMQMLSPDLELHVARYLQRPVTWGFLATVLAAQKCRKVVVYGLTANHRGHVQVRVPLRT
jgi:hypothetical protein